MILTADVLARASHIYGLLGKEMAEVGFMSRRTAHLDRLVMHMEIYLHLGSMKWVRAPALSEQALSRTMKSMQSEEGRREYVRKGLEAQWKCMGTGAGKVELGEHGNVLVSSR